MKNSFKYQLKKLPISQKLVLAGSLVAALSVFLPWYSDVDKFGIGDTFLGITGPMYLGGVFVLLAAGASFSVILLRLLDRPEPRLPMDENHFHIATSSFSILMMVVALSTFFHNKFGINLIDKSIGIGLMLAFGGSIVVLLGGLFMVKSFTRAESKKKEEPVMIYEEEEESFERQQQPVKSYDLGAMAVKNAVQESLNEMSEVVANDTVNRDHIKLNEELNGR